MAKELEKFAELIEATANELVSDLVNKRQLHPGIVVAILAHAQMTLTCNLVAQNLDNLREEMKNNEKERELQQ